MFKEYGERFNGAIKSLKKGIENTEESPLPEILDKLLKMPISSLNKYPLAIKRIIRTIWSDIEIYINYYPYKDGEENKEYLLRGIAELEQLESELNKL